MVYDPGPPSWDSAAETFSFFLHKRGCESVLCFIAINVLENAVQSGDLSKPALTQIFDPTSSVWSKSLAGSRGNARDTTGHAKVWC